ncbi:hypothetical protein B0T20DRAFT_234605 [Sordaria brevicollis]|uniref:Uncharacterized protein n=1 Tax=Sordaria brevicollis TaxID=83679 RepID=A0AAE0PDI3_SORBR|nr:hypothetical protein B0T20DRAFT_234605 [Sordaria brevicollis]
MCSFIDRNSLQPLLPIPASQWTDTIRPVVISVALALAHARLSQQEETVASRTTDVGWTGVIGERFERFGPRLPREICHAHCTFLAHPVTSGNNTFNCITTDGDLTLWAPYCTAILPLLARDSVGSFVSFSLLSCPSPSPFRDLETCDYSDEQYTCESNFPEGELYQLASDAPARDRRVNLLSAKVEHIAELHQHTGQRSVDPHRWDLSEPAKAGCFFLLCKIMLLSITRSPSSTSIMS